MRATEIKSVKAVIRITIFLLLFSVTVVLGDESEMTREEALLTTQLEGVRDPFILYDDGKYYMYCTGYYCYVNKSGRLDKGWTRLSHRVVAVPEDGAGDWWAPEVYRYGDGYYMFATYRMASTGRRGVAVYYSDDPAGMFTLISDKCVTPRDWDAIDGTLYIDPDGTPWMVFVHEWTSTDDGVGRFAAAQLSEDLTHFVTEPVELFRADDAKWCKSAVTDGCFLYTTESGQLLLIWSSWNDEGYSIGIARSDSGSVLGKWTHDDEMLYTKSFGGKYDGGHGCIFKDKYGKLAVSLHSPNNAADGRRETMVLIPVKEENDTLVWDTEARMWN